ncbi:hypothetical protein [Amycolatopsis sp. NPDC021455]|uniref:hypothetical protein n=1 Tax=Amycolatopsis sp. NPDC021455 TaxID=3154901 RepID=UPI0033F285F7
MNRSGSHQAIDASLRKSIAEHDPRLDSALFNGGTVLALGATILATAASWPADLSWLPRALTGLAAFLIGVERALNFGERWRYHRRLRDSYRSLHDRFTLASELPSPQSDELLTKIIDDLERLRRTEGDIPRGGWPPD